MSSYILSKSAFKCIRHAFSDKEDEQLKKLVQIHGEHDWKVISNALGTRSPRQCRERYRNYLMPGIENGPWTTEEENLLISKFNEIGPRWTVLTQYFPTRSEINIKNRWAALSKRMKSRQNSQNKTRAESQISKEEEVEKEVPDNPKKSTDENKNEIQQNFSHHHKFQEVVPEKSINISFPDSDPETERKIEEFVFAIEQSLLPINFDSQSPFSIYNSNFF